VIHITEQEVVERLSVAECVEVLRDAFSRDFTSIPRYRLKSKNSLLHVMSASIPELNIMGLKSYGASRDIVEFAVLLFEEATGRLLAMLEADRLGQIRTGAASGLATDLLARADAAVGAVIGTGFQGETQALAIDAVRRFSEIRIFSRSEEHRREFVRRQQPKVRATLRAAESAEECVRDADVICTITSSRDPVLFGEWLKPGCHINAAGVNWHNKRELDEAAVRRAGLIVTDHLEQSKIEAGDLIGVVDWAQVRELSETVKGSARRTSPDQITLFKSNGIAMEDIAAARFVYNKIMTRSAGRKA
jgi:ornithine cyclodeaminase/alanine dehydrogenase-like protein (mu-crystallin family)